MTNARTRINPVDPESFEEEEPRPRRRARQEAPWSDDEAAAPRRRRDSESVDEETGDEDADGDETIIPIARGRAAIKKSRPDAASSLYFKWADDGGEQVVKFLDVDPWSYNSHWVTRTGKQSFVCIGKDCPLCEIGVKNGQKIVYTVLNLSHQDGPTVQVLEVTPTVDEELIALDGGKSGPLPRLYWSVSRPKKAKPVGFAKYNYVFTPIKERDLEEDYGVDLDKAEAALEKAEVPEPTAVLGKVTRKMLQDIADEVMD